MNLSTRAYVTGVVAAAVLLVPATASACPVCFGDASGPMAEALNNGVLVMLGIVASVQFGFVALFVAIWRRSKRLNERKEALTVIDGGKS